MLKILFPPGCYGTYVTRCLYNYTNLRKGEYEPFKFDLSGSSHVHRLDKISRKYILNGHHNTLKILPDDELITILPDSEHFLDYYDNQFHKQADQQVIDYILYQLSQDQIITKLKDNWNYTEPFNESVPRWILREFCSFWIQDCFNDGYNVDRYKNFKSLIHIGAQDIFLNFIETFKQLCIVAKLDINIDLDLISQDNNNFCKVQPYHNIQLDCNRWVELCLKNQLSCPSPCRTIFDEAYVQQLFRQHGYEIQCDGLNVFPTTSDKMISIIYKQ